MAKQFYYCSSLRFAKPIVNLPTIPLKAHIHHNKKDVVQGNPAFFLPQRKGRKSSASTDIR
jgi:hypothetical protein